MNLKMKKIYDKEIKNIMKERHNEINNINDIIRIKYQKCKRLIKINYSYSSFSLNKRTTGYD